MLIFVWKLLLCHKHISCVDFHVGTSWWCLWQACWVSGSPFMVSFTRRSRSSAQCPTPFELCWTLRWGNTSSISSRRKRTSSWGRCYSRYTSFSPCSYSWISSSPKCRWVDAWWRYIHVCINTHRAMLTALLAFSIAISLKCKIYCIYLVTSKSRPRVLCVCSISVVIRVHRENFLQHMVAT